MKSLTHISPHYNLVGHESVRKPRLRGLARLKKLIEDQDKLSHRNRYEVIKFKGIPSNPSPSKNPTNSKFPESPGLKR